MYWIIFAYVEGKKSEGQLWFIEHVSQQRAIISGTEALLKQRNLPVDTKIKTELLYNTREAFMADLVYNTTNDFLDILNKKD